MKLEVFSVSQIVVSQILSYERQRTVKNGKSFPRYAKPTRLPDTGLRENNTLEMATEVLLHKTDEVARNGAFGEHFGQR